MAEIIPLICSFVLSDTVGVKKAFIFLLKNLVVAGNGFLKKYSLLGDSNTVKAVSNGGDLLEKNQPLTKVVVPVFTIDTTKNKRKNWLFSLQTINSPFFRGVKCFIIFSFLSLPVFFRVFLVIFPLVENAIPSLNHVCSFFTSKFF